MVGEAVEAPSEERSLKDREDIREIVVKELTDWLGFPIPVGDKRCHDTFPKPALTLRLRPPRSTWKLERGYGHLLAKVSRVRFPPASLQFPVVPHS